MPETDEEAGRRSPDPNSAEPNSPDPGSPDSRASGQLPHGLPPRRLHWPDGLDEAAFLADHWQRVPLLLRGALPDFVTPLPPAELAGLSLEPDVGGRLIRKHGDGTFELEHGPFEADTFTGLGPRDWSLLVTDVDKHLPELAAWIHAFRVAPDWRLDDLMVSHAPDGSSVGAHVDEYDVFLLQASGTRRWSIDAGASARTYTKAQGAPPTEHAAGDLRLVRDFTPSDTWDLEPGDVLYLPPGVPHHGVAVGEDCTTWSIGFRAPSAADIVLHAAELVGERLAARVPQQRLRDDARGRGRPGEISATTVDAVAAVLREALALDRAALVELAGQLLTRSGMPADDHGADDGIGDDAGVDADSLVPAPFARLAWHDAETGDRVTLFANGEPLDCDRDLAIRLCAGVPCRRDEVEARDVTLLDALRDEGVLIPPG